MLQSEFYDAISNLRIAYERDPDLPKIVQGRPAQFDEMDEIYTPRMCPKMILTGSFDARTRSAWNSRPRRSCYRSGVRADEALTTIIEFAENHALMLPPTPSSNLLCRP